jgi:cysteine protease ATG4
MYVRILTWFLDNPSGQAPFGVHRMALAGKELGKEVGSWFGPSTAAGAIKRLVGEFEDAGLEIVVAVDSSVYECDVYAASAAPRGRHARASTSESKASTKHKKGHVQKWGDRAVLVLVGIRLGIDGVNPIYYESVKVSQLSVALPTLDLFFSSSDTSLDTVYFPAIRGYCWWSPFVLLLFCWIPK